MKDKKKVFRFEMIQDEFPVIRKPKNAKVKGFIDELNRVHIMGNSQGLLYLAKKIIAMGLYKRKKKDGFHIHLEPEELEVDSDSLEITISNSDFFVDE